MALVSRAIGKNHAYIQQFLERRVPKELSYKTANALAVYLGLDLSLLGYESSVGDKGGSISGVERRLLNIFRNLDSESQGIVFRLMAKMAKSE